MIFFNFLWVFVFVLNIPNGFWNTSVLLDRKFLEDILADSFIHWFSHKVMFVSFIVMVIGWVLLDYICM